MVDGNADFGGLPALPEQRHFIDRKKLEILALNVTREHAQGVENMVARIGNTFGQARGRVAVHQKADRAAIHAVKRYIPGHILMHDLEHETVPAEHDNDIGATGLFRSASPGDVDDIVAPRDFIIGGACYFGGVGDTGDFQDVFMNEGAILAKIRSSNHRIGEDQACWRTSAII